MAIRQVALLRGINVGKAKRIAMADLRALFVELGFKDVATLLNSGNVIFTAPRAVPGAKLEKAIEERTGVSSRVKVLTAAEIAETIAGNALGPDAAADASRLLVAIYYGPEGRVRVAPLAAQDWSPDSLHVGSLAAYMWCKGGILESKLVVAAGKALGDGATARNWATMLKLQAAVDVQ